MRFQKMEMNTLQRNAFESYFGVVPVTVKLQVQLYQNEQAVTIRGGPCDYCVNPSPFGLDFGTSDSGLTIRSTMDMDWSLMKKVTLTEPLNLERG